MNLRTETPSKSHPLTDTPGRWNSLTFKVVGDYSQSVTQSSRVSTVLYVDGPRRNYLSILEHKERSGSLESIVLVDSVQGIGIPVKIPPPTRSTFFQEVVDRSREPSYRFEGWYWIPGHD